MSRASYVILAIVILIASVGVVGWSFFGLGVPKPPPASPNSNQNASEPSSSSNTVLRPDGTVVLPVDIENPAVDFAALVYRFVETVQEVRKSDEGLELITDIQIPGAPRFFLTPTTAVYFADQSQRFVGANSADLKPNQRVSIYTVYNLKQKQWYVRAVSIIVASIPLSSPSATTR